MPAAKGPAWDRPGPRSFHFPFFIRPCTMEKAGLAGLSRFLSQTWLLLKGPRASPGARLPEARGQGGEDTVPSKKGECGLQPPEL